MDDLQNQYTPEEVDEILDWVDSLEISEIKFLKSYWEDLHKGKPVTNAPLVN